ncbi:MAG: endonuclease, partial [Jatrophihabitantaceae bacterium]|nr:endonuclease [Jatrophihabitantaceae bacterium]
MGTGGFTATAPLAGSAPSGVDLLAAAIDALAAEALGERSAGALGERVIALDVLGARFRFEQSRGALAFDTAGGPLDDGFQSAQSWLRANTMAGPGEAKDLVTTGRALRDRLPATSAAAADGQVSWA